MRHSTCLSGIILITSFLFVSCTNDGDENLNQVLADLLENASPTGELSYFELPSSNDYGHIPQDPRNPITDKKVELGKLLFHETALSVLPKNNEGMGTYSCASCHHAGGGFQAGIVQGIGEGGEGYGFGGESRVPNSNYELDSIDVQPIRTPSVLNIAYQTNILWNGQFGATHKNEGTEAQWTEGTPKAVNKLGYEGTETQAIAGLSVHRMNCTEEMITTFGYKGLFDAAFSDFPTKDRYTIKTAGLAIAAYERTVLANKAPFQQWLKGNQGALFDRELEGAILFFGKAECVSCHTGPGLSSMAFYALGMPNLSGAGTYGTSAKDVENLGRGGFTTDPNDHYKFKVPQLYNLKDSKFYGHGGNFRSIVDIIEYKNNAVQAVPAVPVQQLASQFHPLNLTATEIDRLSVFIENALYDPNLPRYEPASLLSGNCFPNNDIQTRLDRNCN